MRVTDLSHRIHPEIPVYPGTEPPLFVPAASIERNGFVETKISMFSHTATHLDAPSHVLKDGKSLEGFDVGHFVGRALILDVSGIRKDEIAVDSLACYRMRLEQTDFALIKTGWSRRWGRDEYFRGFPTLSAESAEWLARFKLKGVGVDAISVDPVDSVALPAHHVLLGNEIVIIENLTNLDAVKSEEFHFSCFPLKISNADGSPVRAVAIEGLGS
jgi:kynurenine formamidase